MTTAELLALLDARRLELGLSHMELGKAAFGRDDNSALSNLQRGSSPTFERLQNICTALGLEVRVEKPRSLQGLAEDSGDTDYDSPNLGRQGYLPIPWLDAEIGKGSAPLAFKASWLDVNRLNPERLSAVLPDISMVDRVDAGRTVAIIEARAERRGSGQLWCLRETGKVILARVAFVVGGFVIMPPRVDQAPRVVLSADPSAPHPIGRVACLAVATPP
jgi:transcriptional regulator with XRE-family HTH domain